MDSPSERGVAHLVRSLAPLTAPDAAARERMRRRVLAELGPPDSGGTRPVSGRGSRAPRNRPSGGERGSSRPGDLPRPGAGARGRFAIAALALLALVLSLAGMSLLLARDALPGDALYGIKRTAEAAALGLTFGDEPKALKHLEFASARVNEIETLAERYPSPADAPIGGYLTALSDFDNDAAAGSRQLIALATRNDGRQLESLRAWATQQSGRLDEIATRLPGAARNRQSISLALLSKIASRSDALLARMQCYQITTGSFDDVGALPATGTCERIPGATVRPAAGAAQSPAPGNGTPIPGRPLTSTTQPPPSDGTPSPTAPDQPLPSGTVPVEPPPAGSPPGTPPGTPDPDAPPTIILPLPLPTVDVPPLLPGLPGIRVGA